ncbi:MAG: hypothetical protein JXA99_07320 [Candidatus Lokiarchaeota archaeon]|nr:hypothetical protein [Candidatus Lokiarchaeota archaeon]
MTSTPEQAVYNLMQKDPTILAVAVITGKDNITYQTNNWDISPDIGQVISSWTGQNAQFIKISGVKYSILQMTAERLTAISIRGEGSIVAAKDDEHKIIAYVSPDGDMRGSMMDTARALGEMSTKTSYLNDSTSLGKGYTAPVQSVGGHNIDPGLKSEIQLFLDWVKDNEGLAGYIKYYLQQNNIQIISQLSKIYISLKTIFGL